MASCESRNDWYITTAEGNKVKWTNDIHVYGMYILPKISSFKTLEMIILKIQSKANIHVNI